MVDSCLLYSQIGRKTGQNKWTKYLIETHVRKTDSYTFFSGHGRTISHTVDNCTCLPSLRRPTRNKYMTQPMFEDNWDSSGNRCKTIFFLCSRPLRLRSVTECARAPLKDGVFTRVAVLRNSDHRSFFSCFSPCLVSVTFWHALTTCSPSFSIGLYFQRWLSVLLFSLRDRREKEDSPSFICIETICAFVNDEYPVPVEYTWSTIRRDRRSLFPVQATLTRLVIGE